MVVREMGQQTATLVAILVEIMYLTSYLERPKEHHNLPSKTAAFGHETHGTTAPGELRGRAG